ncbi:hypothetical protein HanRHA438_Chr11g0518081 [Helianthus annuus]|nr:hypothetical protein HanIR_Chr11g0544061 [Helianthus annuus]KAJ0871932.1 hypothetical protein HanRHA438_Chr11g0518081 [Helianthus annuus]
MLNRSLSPAVGVKDRRSLSLSERFPLLLIFLLGNRVSISGHSRVFGSASGSSFGSVRVGLQVRVNGQRVRPGVVRVQVSVFESGSQQG